MSFFIRELIKSKLNEITLNDLIHYSKQYGFSITETEAKQILLYIRNNELDPFDQNNLEKMFQDLAQITNRETAIKAQKLFNEIISSYGLGHLFD